MPIMVVVNIGENVRRERSRRFWTQEQLAEKAGVSPRQVVRIERNEVEPRFATIIKLAQALDVEPDVLAPRD